MNERKKKKKEIFGRTVHIPRFPGVAMPRRMNFGGKGVKPFANRAAFVFRSSGSGWGAAETAVARAARTEKTVVNFMDSVR